MSNAQLGAMAEWIPEILEFRERFKVDSTSLNDLIASAAMREYSRRMWFNEEPFEGPEDVREWFREAVPVIIGQWAAEKTNNLGEDA